MSARLSGSPAAVQVRKQPKSCRVLHLEDSLADAELIVERLRLDGFAPEVTRVDDRIGYTEVLADKADRFDLILADYSLPSFDGASALAIARKLAPEIPFIFVSGTLGEETAIEAIQAGATDYVVKQRIGRLSVVVRRTLAEAAERTERYAAEKALSESEARFRHMADSAPALIWMTGEDGKVNFASRYFDHMLDRPAEEMLGEGWAHVVLAEDLGSFCVTTARAFRNRQPFRSEVRVYGKNNHVLWMRCEGVPRLDQAGRFVGYTGYALDITESRLAAELLEARVAERTAELMQAQESLVQSQKMEAVGQLTGGLAHDFNNLLAGITGSLELLQARMSQGRLNDLDRYLAAAQGAAKRAAALTHRLLAFTRRQTLDPKPINVNRLAREMEELIRRSVGPAITVQVVEAADLWSTLVDPNQLENALLNLCINSRDAMPHGGLLTIETSNQCLDTRAARERDLRAGQYVSLCVSDSGSGMTLDVVRRAFDPFFTTKPIGMGTGLGLSMVYGFVRQSGGHAHIDSVPDQGTTVCLYLPRHFGLTEEPEMPAELSEAPRASRGETVLVVDDEPTVRMLITEVLEDLGYTAIEAADGPSGLKVLNSDVRLDLLVTDVGLPGGLNGRQVADAGRAVRPGLKVLFITGYAENAVLSQGQLDAGMHVLTKPFAMETLASRIKELIANQPTIQSGSSLIAP